MNPVTLGDTGTEGTELTEENRGARAAPEDGFDDFWRTYPDVRKTARTKCLRTWKSLGLAERAAEVMRSLRAWIASEVWTKDSGRFICAPLKWLTEERFEIRPEPFREPGDNTAPMDPDEAEEYLKSIQPGNGT